MVCHHLDKCIPEDIAFAESRIRAETVAAEDVLHDSGAISMISSDSQAMGRVGEVVSRTWRTASKLRSLRGPLTELGDNEECDNGRVKRYISKYTINPWVFFLDSRWSVRGTLLIPHRSSSLRCVGPLSPQRDHTRHQHVHRLCRSRKTCRPRSLETRKLWSKTRDGSERWCYRLGTSKWFDVHAST
jgi:hypothetical protein